MSRPDRPPRSSSERGRTRVAILGGGPAGSFCAIWLSALSAHAGSPFEITLFDYKSFAKPGPAGCNMCAGIIPDSLVRSMRGFGIQLPEHVIQRRVRGYRLETRGGHVDIPTPPGVELYSTFRGPGPLGMYPSAQEGFDFLLLREAEKRGVAYVHNFVTDLHLPDSPADPFVVACRDGAHHEADIVVGAFGVNSNLVRTFEGLGFGYRAPRVARAYQAEIPVDPDFIEREMADRVLIFALGWRHLQFAAITPKRQHVTVTLIGTGPRRVDLEDFLDSPYVRRRMPPGWQPPERFCSCAPRLPLTAARRAVHDRIVVIGDAHVARYLKNGIESSFHTACWAARAIVAGDLGAGALARRYVSRCQTYVHDNRYGRALFKLHDLIAASPTVSRAHIRVARSEQASSHRPKRLSTILWGMFTGNIPYRQIALRLLDPRLHLEIAGSLAATALGAAPARPVPNGNGAGPRPGLGPLQPEQTVLIVGGGPAGAACAIALAHEGERLRRLPRIILIEEKRFGEHQNQCAGVISPPGLDLIEQLLALRVPPDLLQREIRGYVLHADGDALFLSSDELGGRDSALRRVLFDRLLLEAARRSGAQIVHTRAGGVEVNAEGVVLYTESGTFHGDVVVGAFGLDPGTAQVFARSTRYRPPPPLETLACKLHPAGMDYIPDLLDDAIHVFLPPERRLEFGALIPKGNHVTAVLAGRRLREADMMAFLARYAGRFIPAACDVMGSFKGSFPLGPARHLRGDRYLIIGDAAGLVRPFKGKGINNAIEAGWLAALTMLTRGISRQAFDEFARTRRHLTGDLAYGRLVRRLAELVSRLGLLVPFVAEARTDPDLRQALYDCISGRTTYRSVVLRRANRRLVPRMIWKCARHLLLRRSRPGPVRNGGRSP